MAVFAVNSTVCPEGPCAVLLVFGVIPRPAHIIPSMTQLERARTISAAITEVEQEQARRRISFGLRHIGGPKRTETSEKLHHLPAGSKVLVYRTTTKTLEGPHIFIDIVGETVVEQTKRDEAYIGPHASNPSYFQRSHLPALIRARSQP